MQKNFGIRTLFPAMYRRGSVVLLAAAVIAVFFGSAANLHAGVIVGSEAEWLSEAVVSQSGGDNSDSCPRAIPGLNSHQDPFSQNSLGGAGTLAGASSVAVAILGSPLNYVPTGVSRMPGERRLSLPPPLALQLLRPPQPDC